MMKFLIVKVLYSSRTIPLKKKKWWKSQVIFLPLKNLQLHNHTWNRVPQKHKASSWMRHDSRQFLVHLFWCLCVLVCNCSRSAEKDFKMNSMPDFNTKLTVLEKLYLFLGLAWQLWLISSYELWMYWNTTVHIYTQVQHSMERVRISRCSWYVFCRYFHNIFQKSLISELRIKSPWERPNSIMWFYNNQQQWILQSAFQILLRVLAMMPPILKRKQCKVLKRIFSHRLDLGICFLKTKILKKTENFKGCQKWNNFEITTPILTSIYIHTYTVLKILYA